MFQTGRFYLPDTQIVAMKKWYPQFTHKRIGKETIEFRGDLLVKPSMPAYTVSITYRGNLRPHVKIVHPTLVEEPPHFYQNTKTLCLYHPNNYKWVQGKLLIKEIVPWTAAWIYFYEVWLQEGEWYGPSAHDAPNFEILNK